MPSIMLTYDSWADGHYISKHDQRKAGLHILRPSTQQVGVGNGGTSNAKYVTQLPFCKLSAWSRQADTFQDFPTFLMSLGKTLDNGMVSVFTKEGIKVFKEEEVLITCKGEPILIGIWDNQGQYWIPLMQQWGHWQPQCPSKQAWKVLRHANSIYDLPSTKQAIKWMHAVCGYPVKSTWLKAIKAGNYVGWPMLTERNVQKYYPKTIKTAKGHLNWTRKNVQSTKVKATPLENGTLPTSPARRCATCTPKHTWYTKPCSPTKQASSPSNLFVATSTSWLWWKSTGTPYLSSPWRTARTPRWYGHASTPVPTQMGRNCPQETCPQQCGIQKHEESYSWHVQSGYGIGATRLPQMQHSQGRHTQLQSPLPQHLSRCSRRLSTKPMGLAAPTNQDHNQSDSTI